MRPSTLFAALAGPATMLALAAPAASGDFDGSKLRPDLERSPSWVVDFDEQTFDKRIVVDEKITSPSATTIWHTGQKGVNVTWEVTPDATGYNGNLLLGWLFANYTEDPNEHLSATPLATGFPLSAGSVSFDIPCSADIPSRDSYIVVLMGDSGNASPQFTIYRDVEACPELLPST